VRRRFNFILGSASLCKLAPQQKRYSTLFTSHMKENFMLSMSTKCGT
jgi:glutathione peroxidase-family protein